MTATATMSIGDENADTVPIAAPPAADDDHFLKAAAQFADRQEVVASEDIFTSSGMKLVSRGTRLSGSFYDRLVAHKLLKPIEQTLSTTATLDQQALIFLVCEEAKSIPALNALLDGPDLPEKLHTLFGAVKIPAALSFRLSVTQTERPIRFRHLLKVTMIAVALGIRGGLTPEQLRALALAGLFHDLGELSIDPAILSPEHQMTGDERRHLYVHPVTGFMILREYPEIPESAAQAVLQHHEFIDGSGYPSGLRGEQLGSVSRFLAVAEATAALMEQFGLNRRIATLLYSNRHKFDATAAAIVGKLFSDIQYAVSTEIDEVDAIIRLGQASSVFRDWIAVQTTGSSLDTASDSVISQRMNYLRRMVLEVGFDPCQLEEALPLVNSEGAEMMAELKILLDELEWQFKSLAREIERTLFRQGIAPPAEEGSDTANWLTLVNRYA